MKTSEVISQLHNICIKLVISVQDTKGLTRLSSKVTCHIVYMNLGYKIIIRPIRWDIIIFYPHCPLIRLSLNKLLTVSSYANANLLRAYRRNLQRANVEDKWDRYLQREYHCLPGLPFLPRGLVAFSDLFPHLISPGAFSGVP